MKKTYISPVMLKVTLQHQSNILDVSQVTTTGDVDLNYDPNGGNQSNAWVKGNDYDWDMEW